MTLRIREKLESLAPTFMAMASDEGTPEPRTEFEPSGRIRPYFPPISPPTPQGPRIPIHFPDMDKHPWEGTGFGDRTMLQPGKLINICTLTAAFAGFIACTALYLRSGGENSFIKKGAYAAGAVLLTSAGYNHLLV